MAIRTESISQAGAQVRVGDWLVEPNLNRISRGGSTVQIESKAMDVLVFLAGRAGEVASHSELQDGIWQTEFVSYNTVANRISELREALEDDARDPRYIETIPKRGYRLIAEVSFGAVAEPDPGVLAEVRREQPDDRSPYPGLAPFGESDSEDFFGREAEIAALWRKITSRRLLAVIGASGSGKSSLVRAGVVARAPLGWRAVVCQPGEEPFLAVARALAPDLLDDAEEMKRLLAFHDPDMALAAAARWRGRWDEALLVVDQFEELFTLNPEPVRERFADLLRRLVDAAGIHVVLVLRDDFLLECHRHPQLAPIFGDLTPIGPPAGRELRRAVTEPAARRLYGFESESMVDEMVEGVGAARGALPLLAFAVSRLWELRNRERRLLTREAYEQIGGVGGALAQHAEAALGAIGEEQLPVVRELFRNLVTAQGTRAVRDVDELLSVFEVGSRAEARSVLRALVNARLLTSFEDEEADEAAGGTRHRVEVVHESLLGAWPRLVRWQAQDADGALLRDQLRQAARTWDERDRSDDLLWSSSAFREYAVWRERYPGGLSELEEAFAAAMTELATRRRRRRRLAVTLVISVLVAGLGVVGSLWRRSELETHKREAAQLLALGRLKLADSPSTALAFAIASLERAENAPARSFAVEALWQGPSALILADPVEPMFASWSPDSRWLALGGIRGLATLERGAGERRQLSTSSWQYPVGFSADGQRLVTQDMTADPRQVFNVWALPGGRLDRTFDLPERSRVWMSGDRLLTLTFDSPEPLRPRSIPVRALSLDGKTEQELGLWGPRGRVAVDADPSGTFLFSLRDGDLIQQRLDDLAAPGRVIGTHAGAARFYVRPWRDRAATVDGAGELRIWDVPAARLERTLQIPRDTHSIALDPRGQFLATAKALMTTRSVFLFDLGAPRTAEPLPLLGFEETSLGINSMTFSPDGSWLAIGIYGSAVVWNLESVRSTIVGRHEPPGVELAFTPDGDLLSASSGESGLKRWPLSLGSEEGVRELWSRPGAVPVVIRAVDPGGRFVIINYGFDDEMIAVPLDGSPASIYSLGRSPEGIGVNGILGSVDPGGRFLAIAAFQFAHPEASSIRILDLSTGDERILDTHPKGGVLCEEPGSEMEGFAVPVWLADGRLVSDGGAGLRVWNLATGTSRLLRACRKIPSVGFFLLATPDSRMILRLDPGETTGLVSSLTVFDLASGATREITSHGNRVQSFALDASGTILVTGDKTGVVRAGLLAGEEPHLLFGHAGTVFSVAVSPDGHWIASGGDDGTIRLWPMPDLSKPPLHTLPHNELLAKLKSLTNLRAVRDPSSDTGWKTEIGPFPGWAEVPEWQP